MGYKMTKVKIPATTANLGPGFDSFALALSLYNEITVEEKGDYLRIEVEGPYKRSLPLGKKNLVYKGIIAVFEACNRSVEGLLIRIISNIPVSRGLGSSAAAIVGGLVAANELLGAEIPKEELFNMAAEIEGHPDNVAAAIFGGFTIAVPDEAGKVKALSFAPHPNIGVSILIPGQKLETTQARQILPHEVEMEDCVFNISRAGLLVSVLLTGRTNWLKLATQDKLHQPFRKRLIPAFAEIGKKLDTEGIALALSGAGPSLIALYNKADARRIESILRRVISELEIDYEVLNVEVAKEGAIVLPTNKGC
jgi:homoserine kinase